MIRPIVVATLMHLVLSGDSAAQERQSNMPVRDFVALESSQQHAIAGAVVGIALGLVALLKEFSPSEPLPPALECVDRWEREQPGSYLTTLAAWFVNMAELETLAANLGDTPVAAETVAARPVLELFFGALEATCDVESPPLRTGSGQLDGPFEEYYANGQTSVRTMLRNGRQYGRFESFHINGQLGRVGTLNEDSEWSGLYEEYDEAGRLQMRGSYRNSPKGVNARCGEWFDPPGVTSLTEAMRPDEGGVRNGDYVTYAPCSN